MACLDCSLAWINHSTGHKAYLGFMYLDYTYNNAVVHVFLGLLRHSLREHLLESAGSVLSDDGGGEGRRRSPCKNTSEI